MTISDALLVALAPTRKAIHDLGYPNADDAIERAALRLAEEVDACQKMRCEGCRWAVREDDTAMCMVSRHYVPCDKHGGGCLAFEPRVGDEP